MTKNLNWWQTGGLAIVYLAIAYGFASWAINSAHLLTYVGGIVFLVAGIRGLIRAIRLAPHK